MAQALDAATARLRETIGAMAQSSQALAGASEELSAVSGQMSGSAEGAAAQAGTSPSAARAGHPQRPGGGDRHRGAVGVDRRDRAQRGHAAAGVAAEAVQVAEHDHRHRRQAGRLLGRDRQRRQGDQLDRRADEPARAQRHHRGSPRRRGRQGLRGRGQRGQGARPGDREGDRGDQPPDRGDPGRHRRRGAAIAEFGGSSARSTTSRARSPSAVEEQTATTNEITRNVAEAAAGSADIADTITGVAALGRRHDDGRAEHPGVSRRAGPDGGRDGAARRQVPLLRPVSRRRPHGPAPRWGRSGHDRRDP